MADAEGTQQYSREFVAAAAASDNQLGPLRNLPGTWKSVGKGWNMIALPFKDVAGGAAPYRILMNQYDETLTFAFVDDNVPNRGVEVDQRIATIDYQQQIQQTKAEDFPPSQQAGDPGLPIHHEPGLWIWTKDQRTDNIDVARLASIPHGNSVLCLGESSEHPTMPIVAPINALPLGRFEDLATPAYDLHGDDYLAPYRHFLENPFGRNDAERIGFPGFSPHDMTEILRFENEGLDIGTTTQLTVDSMREAGGVTNMPFVTKEAEPVSMKSTYWIQEVNSGGHTKLRMQYAQIVMLNFFRPREDELPGRAQWPHVSICTLEKHD